MWLCSLVVDAFHYGNVSFAFAKTGRVLIDSSHDTSLVDCFAKLWRLMIESLVQPQSHANPSICEGFSPGAPDVRHAAVFVLSASLAAVPSAVSN